MHTNTRVENYTRVSCVDFAWKSAILHAIPVGQNLFRTSNLTGDHCQFCLGDVISDCKVKKARFYEFLFTLG